MYAIICIGKSYIYSYMLLYGVAHTFSFAPLICIADKVAVGKQGAFVIRKSIWHTRTCVGKTTCYSPSYLCCYSLFHPMLMCAGNYLQSIDS